MADVPTQTLNGGGYDPERSHLLWRTFARQKEFRDGALHLNKETILRTFKNNPKQYLYSSKFDFIKNISPIIRTAVSLDVPALLARVYDSFQKEISYATNRKEQFSMDILFQVIETLTMEYGEKKAGSEIESLNEKSTITKQDIDNILKYLNAYNKMAARFQACGNFKKAIEMSDEIISTGAVENHDIPILALESIFNLIMAQFVLASKYQCDTLIKAWKKEYGFDDGQIERVVKLIPPNNSLLDFRNLYAKAIRQVNETKDQDMMGEMDLFLLRTMSNYYTSWISQVANQISNKAA